MCIYSNTFSFWLVFILAFSIIDPNRLFWAQLSLNVSFIKNMSYEHVKNTKTQFSSNRKR